MKLRHVCQANFAGVIGHRPHRMTAACWLIAIFSGLIQAQFRLTPTLIVRVCGIITFTYTMPPAPQAKRQALQATGTFNPRSAHVRHPLFQQSSFFDPQDLLQLKYETLRALELDQCSLAKAARDFGLSRPTIYGAQMQFAQQGMEGLLPRKRGPKAAHKLTRAVLQYLGEQTVAEPRVKAEELARRVRERYAVHVHPRTIQKALRKEAKKGRP